MVYHAGVRMFKGWPLACAEQCRSAQASVDSALCGRLDPSEERSRWWELVGTRVRREPAWTRLGLCKVTGVIVGSCNVPSTCPHLRTMRHCLRYYSGVGTPWLPPSAAPLVRRERTYARWHSTCMCATCRCPALSINVAGRAGRV